jgi:hypothetical protein
VILNGRLVETNQSRILEPIYLIDQTTAKNWNVYIFKKSLFWIQKNVNSIITILNKYVSK